MRGGAEGPTASNEWDMTAAGPDPSRYVLPGSAPVPPVSHVTSVNASPKRVLIFLPDCTLADTIHTALDSTDLEEHYIAPTTDADVDRFVDEASWASFFDAASQRAGRPSGWGSAHSCRRQCRHTGASA